MTQKINILLKSMSDSFRKYPRRYILFGGFLLLISLSIAICWPRTISFSYAEKTCIYQPTIAPGALRSRSDAYRLEADQKLRIGSVTLAAMRLCVVPLEAPKVGGKEARLSVVGLPFLQKTYTVVASEPPRVQTAGLSEKPIPLSRALEVPISATDRVFSYKAAFGDGREADCTIETGRLSCAIQKLQLRQGERYRLSINRYFNSERIETIGHQEVTTLTATAVTGGSITQGQIVYAKPKNIELKTDKDIAEVKLTLVELNGEQRRELPTKVVHEGKNVTVSWDEELKRQARFELIADSVIGTDGSGLDGAYILQFETSGGPKVKNISVGSYKVPLGATATILFDQPILESQNIGAAISVTGGAKVASVKGSQVLVSFDGVPRCGDVTISINDTLKSEHAVTGGSRWQFATRTVCQTQTVIGTSVKGRSIIAYSFGGGGQTILYTGAIHGNEASTRSLMLRWIDELEARPRSIPADKTVVVVPVINPDGVASGSRTNANNVDLNRNFATSDWKSDITTVTNTPFPGGGGKTAMSEPETRALANFVSRTRPQLVLSYHSIGGLLAANQAGRSNGAASNYARLSGYANTTGSSDTFEYGISGTADDYYGQNLGVASILIELGSHSYHQFERNQDAMWAMLR